MHEQLSKILLFKETRMNKKVHNHLLPRMVIKRWESANGKIFSKSDESSSSRSVKHYDYSKPYYYSLGKEDSLLEDRISLFEAYVGELFKKINEANDSIIISEKDMEILKLYVILQSCRNENTSSYIKSDESDIYRNNNYIQGVPLLSSQEDVVEFTNSVCDEFERIKNIGDGYDYSYDYKIFNPKCLNSYLSFGLHLVIVSNSTNSFMVSETTAVIECTMDGDYLYTYVPISPKIGLMLVKSRYFIDKEKIEYTKIRFGNKYGNGFPDPWLSHAIRDKKLIYNGKTENHLVTLDIVKLSTFEIYCLNSVIYEDGKRILYCNEEALEKAKSPNGAREVYLSY